MGKSSIRLGSTLVFDSEQEKDIFDRVEYLSNRHKLGEFISNLIRVAFDSPRALESRERLIEALTGIEKYGVTENRFNDISVIKQEIDLARAKIDMIYDMCLKLFTLARMGKRIGLEDRTKNILRAQFLVENELNKLTSKVGIGHLMNEFESTRVSSIEEKVNDIVEYIIESYDGIVNEIKEDTNMSSLSNTSEDVSESIEKEEKAEQREERIKVVPIIKESDESENVEYVDFGDADIDAMAKFFGEI